MGNGRSEYMNVIPNGRNNKSHKGDQKMLRCSWCMKKIKENEPCLGLGVKFAPGFDINEEDGRISTIYMKTRNTSVPLIIVGTGSEARKEGEDGIFSLCSEKCGEKMKEAVKKEINLFSKHGEFIRLT